MSANVGMCPTLQRQVAALHRCVRPRRQHSEVLRVSQSHRTVHMPVDDALDPRGYQKIHV